MKVAVLSDIKKITIEERSIPQVGPADALIKVEACGICGTDVHAYVNGKIYPMGTVMGHECAGIVVKVGEEVSDFAEGDRVVAYGSTPCGICPACKRGLQFYCMKSWERSIGDSVQLDGGFAEYLLIPPADRSLLHIPDSVTFEEATLTDPVATSLHAIRISQFKPGDMVGVLGAGPIGLMAINLLRIGGARMIVCTEISPQRAEAAYKLGADLVLNPSDEGNHLPEKVLGVSGGLGVDIVFECSGVPEAFQQSFQLVRPGGQVMVVGVTEQEVPIVPMDLVAREIDLQGSYWASKYEFELGLHFIEKKQINTDLLLAETVPLEEIEDRGFKRLTSSPDVVKIVVRP